MTIRKKSTKSYYQGLSGLYFYRILKNIIKIGNLESRRIKILDFGCGTKELAQFFPEKVINYDIDPLLTEVSDWRKESFDLIVVNEVFYLFTESELRSLLAEFIDLNPNAELVVGISRQGLLNKVAKILALKFDAHAGTNIKPSSELNILKEFYSIQKKRSVFFMCDIYLLKPRELNVHGN